MPFPLISTVQAVNWQSRKAEFIKNVKYFLWKMQREKKNGPSLFFLLLSLIFHGDLAKLQNLGAFQNWKSQKYFEIETPHQENWKTGWGKKKSKNNSGFHGNQKHFSLSKHTETGLQNVSWSKGRVNNWSQLPGSSLQSWPPSLASGRAAELFAATQELNISAWSFPSGL